MKFSPFRVCRVACLAVLGGCLFGLTASAMADSPPSSGQLSLTLRKAVVFKDGYALIIKQAHGTADDHGFVHTFDVPDTAVLGSFWAVSKHARVLAMKAEYTDTWQRIPLRPSAAQNNLPNLLSAAVGHTVTLTTADGQTYTGTLLNRAAVNDVPVLSLLPEMPTANRLAAETVQPIMLAESKIASLSCPSLASTDPNAAFVRAKRLSFDLGQEAADKPVELSLMYFTPGLRWIPTYRVSGDLKQQADLALQAEILNELEDLKDVALDLVVGVPHFRFSQTISPLSLEASMRNALAQAAPQLMGQMQMSNAMFTQRSGEFRGQPTQPGAAAVELPAELTGQGEQDLFVYSVPQFSLDRGGRATTPLWQSQAPLRHLYTLDMHVVRHAQHGGMVRGENQGQYPAESPLRLLTNQVWHQLELANQSQVPWTTGAAMILRGDLPVGQDLLTYTPTGGSSLLPMTVAVNVRGTLAEEEVERQPNALQWNRSSYTLIRKKGTITRPATARSRPTCASPPPWPARSMRQTTMERSASMTSTPAIGRAATSSRTTTAKWSGR